ncbi:hypothetical protein LAG90_08450 [Marinilongibacter aquaticus]|uniref:hypothetical protein n=1 Tax=Marinilongibacter aquaticus TaxID=2975157 RepID=UPI0021BD6EE5|nr:hypothetical protein [Marinilongibacter aquaticus]UBM60670.1 hypothetical protein LAG90_08450 [Marinilongibacter aquaticus]
MKKTCFTSTKVLPILLFSFLSFGVLAQENVGIGTVNPDPSSILDVSSKTKGFLLPRMSESERLQIENPAKGLMVYQTSPESSVYVYGEQGWAPLSETEASLVTAGNETWNTAGNGGLDDASHFLGTTDETSIVIKANNFQSGLIDVHSGNSFLGYKTGMLSEAYNSVAIGAFAFQKGNTSGNNIAIGFQSQFGNLTGGHNVGIGTGALAVNESGEKNVSLGSLSGYKATGSRNIFLGFESGYDETGSDRLVISNNYRKSPLIYGDLANGKLGINSKELTHALTVNSGVSGKSGLRLAGLTNTSTASATSGYVLSVDSKGEVILVPDEKGQDAPPVIVNALWKETGNNIINANDGTVIIGKGLQLSTFKENAGKYLGLDNSGNVVMLTPPVSPSEPSTPSTGEPAASYWKINDGGYLSPSASYDIFTEKRITAHGVNVGWGGVVFTELNSNYENPFPSNGLALSLDETGHVILTKNSDGGTGGGGTVSSVWANANGTISTPGEEKVVIGQGIESLPSGFSLYVRHGILAERVRVAVANSAKWADYVFDKKYPLMPLNQVEDFVNENSHLPNVPSAEEISEGGLDLAEMSAKQMEKIEELTLYIIDLNKKLEASNKRIESLETQLNAKSN